MTPDPMLSVWTFDRSRRWDISPMAYTLTTDAEARATAFDSPAPVAARQRRRGPLPHG